MSESRPVIHAGINKTGTSWLQKYVFANATSHVPLGRYPGADPAVAQLVSRMQSDPSYEPGSLAAAVKRIAGNRTPLLTDEGLTSTLRFASGDEFTTSVHRLHEEFHDATVLVVVRRQPDLLLASYGQYVRMGGTAPLRKFLSGAPVWGYQHRPDKYDLHFVVSTFQKAFGATNVVVLPYEQLRQDNVKFVSELTARLNLATAEIDFGQASERRINASASAVGRAVHRMVNQTLDLLPVSDDTFPRFRRARRIVTRVDAALRLGRLPFNSVLSEKDAAMVAEASEPYRSSNRDFAGATGLDLARFGYPL